MPLSTVCTVFVSWAEEAERWKKKAFVNWSAKIQKASAEQLVTWKQIYLVRIGVHIKIFQESSCKLTEEKIVGFINCSQTPVSIVV